MWWNEADSWVHERLVDVVTGLATKAYKAVRRDMFAAAALQGLFAGAPPDDELGVIELAESARIYADAMIAELDRVKP